MVNIAFLVPPLLIWSGTQTSVAVIAIGDSSRLEHAILHEMAWQRQNGGEVLGHTDLIDHMTGYAIDGVPTGTKAAEVLQQARNREAVFDLRGAAELRQQVIRAFVHAVCPNQELGDAASAALYDHAAALFMDNKVDNATRVARTAIRRFPDHEPDPKHFSPKVRDFFAAVQRLVAKEPQGTLNIVGTVGVTLMIEGKRLTMNQTATSFDMPFGWYRIWVNVSPGQCGVPLLAKVGKDKVNVTLSTASSVVNINDSDPSLSCPVPCRETLMAMGLTLRLRRIVGLVMESDELLRRIDVDLVGRVVSDKSFPAHMFISTPTASSLRPAYLLPFGTGQFLQDRPIAGTLWLGSEVTLLAWSTFGQGGSAAIVGLSIVAVAGIVDALLRSSPPTR